MTQTIDPKAASGLVAAEIELADPAGEPAALAAVAAAWAGAFRRPRPGVIALDCAEAEATALAEAVAAAVKGPAALSWSAAPGASALERAAETLAASLSRALTEALAEARPAATPADDVEALDAHLEALQKSLERENRRVADEMTMISTTLERLERRVEKEAADRFAAMPADVARLAADVAAEARELISALSRADEPAARREARLDVAAERTARAIAELEGAAGVAPLRLEGPRDAVTPKPRRAPAPEREALISDAATELFGGPMRRARARAAL